MLESGRVVEDTSLWNPFTYGLVFNKTALLDHLLVNGKHLNEMLAVSLKLRDASNCIRYSKEELIDGQVTTLMLLVENKSPNFKVLFNLCQQIISKKLIERILPLVARSKFADYFLDVILKS